MAKKKYRHFLFLLLIVFLVLFMHTLSYFESTKLEELAEVLQENSIVNIGKLEKKKKYVGVLEIPKISLKKGFYNIGYKENTVDKNLEVIETSVMPNQKYSNLILASHSGNSPISYFKNLYKLELGDIAYVYYENKYYTYQLVNVYDEDKDGTILIRTSSLDTNLTLITCDKNKKDTQNVYVFTLLNDLEEFQQ